MISYYSTVLWIRGYFKSSYQCILQLSYVFHLISICFFIKCKYLHHKYLIFLLKYKNKLILNYYVIYLNVFSIINMQEPPTDWLMIIAICFITSCILIGLLCVVCCFWSKCLLFNCCRPTYHNTFIISYGKYNIHTVNS